ncbi:hypothetical protein ACFVS2_25450 [Brevibacillus sp. NPDC058079]|uniref:hypothetical protein n=1 Tax=Brevibacillus sp. NPDC058079 TaxID=3346330 RepID=UPI0036EDF358
MKKVTWDFDFNHDFKEVHDLVIKEQLTEEEIEEGLDPEEMVVKVCVTGHAYKRINHDYGRQCEWNDVEDLILEKGHKLFNMKTDDEFAIVNDNKTMVLICKLYPYKGELVLILETIIRKVIIVNDREVEKKVWLNKETKRV